MLKTLTDKTMDINKDTGQPSQDVKVMVQTQRNGPWTPLLIQVNPQEFIDSKSPDVYIYKLARMGLMGQDLISVDHKYTKKQAELDLK